VSGRRERNPVANGLVYVAEAPTDDVTPCGDTATPRGGPMRPSLPAIAILSLALVVAAPVSAQEEIVDLPAADRPIDLNLEELYSIGSIDGAEWETFQTLDAAVFDRDGRLYLLDAPTARVVAIRDGAFSHYLGQQGDGPGEYRRPEGLVALPDGTLAVWDSGKRAFILFAADGSSLGQVAPDYSAGVPTAPMQSLSDGSVLALPLHMVSGRWGEIYLTGDGRRSAAEGLPLLRVPLRRGAEIDLVTRVPGLQGEGVDPASRAFAPRPSWGPVQGNRVALAISDEYEVRVVDRSGSLLTVLRRPIEARRTTRADEAAFRRFVQERYERSLRQGTRGLRPAPPSDEVNAHPVIPPIRRITAGGAAKIWVQRPDDGDPMRSGPIDILDVEGAYVGTVSDAPLGLPAAFGPDGLVAFLTTGELDVPVARVYRLPEGLR
jgi:hypothetical protein